MHAARLGVALQLFELGDFCAFHGYQQFAQPAVRHLMAAAPGIQAFAAFQAQFGLERAGRVVDAGVDHLGVAAGGVSADQALRLDYQADLPRLAQARGAGQAERAGANNQGIDTVHVRSVGCLTWGYAVDSGASDRRWRSEEHTSELQSQSNLV